MRTVMMTTRIPHRFVMRDITIHQAQNRIVGRRFLAYCIMLLALLTLSCSVLKSIYFMFANDAATPFALRGVVLRAIYAVYTATDVGVLSWLWNTAPVADFRRINTPGNYGFVFILLCVAIGRCILDSAERLSSRVRKTLAKVEELGWERELMGQRRQGGHEVDVRALTVTLDQGSEWYQRPIGIVLLAVAATVLGQWANLQFGLVKP
jgi:hypothetical protein